MPERAGNSFDGDDVGPPHPWPASGLASFEDRVHVRRRDLPAAMQKLLRLIEDDPQLLTDSSITSLAAKAGVAASTVTRLSKALGYSSVARMRVALAREQALQGRNDAWIADVGREITPADEPQALLEKLTFAHLRMIRNAAAQIDVHLLQIVAERIAAADRVDLYAIGGSANAAQMFADRAFRIGIQARVWSEVHAGLVSASFLGPSSVAIGVSSSGRTHEVAQLITEARGTEALTVALVGRPGSRVAGVAELAITTMASEHEDSGDLTPRYSQGFALDLLFLLVARLDVESTRRRLAATARSVERHRRDVEGPRHNDL